MLADHLAKCRERHVKNQSPSPHVFQPPHWVAGLNRSLNSLFMAKN